MSSREAATMREKLLAMAPAQRKLFLEASKKKLSKTRETIPRLTGRDRYALSSPQRRLWFLYRTHPNSSMYNMPECARLHGHIDLAAFQGAFDDVVARHESLRVTFDDSPDGPIQIVADQLSIPVELISVEDATEEEREAAGQLMMMKEADAPFNLKTGPVVRMSLIRLARDYHFLVVNMHHIISDGWSMSVFVEDFAQCLDARLQNKQPELEELPITFGDFAEWQNNRLTGPVLDTQINYWKPIVSNIESLELPFDRLPTDTTSDRGGFEYINFDSALTTQINDCSRRCSATLFMFLLSVFSVLLHYYSGQQSITVGSPTAGRIRTETEKLIGFFANTLLITADVRAESSFLDVVESVKKSSIGAFSHDETPVEKLIEVFNVERDIGRNPLFQVMFILQNSRKPSLRLPGLSVELYSAKDNLEKFDISVKFDMLMDFYETSKGIEGWLGYRADLFDSSTIVRFVDNFQCLMRAVIEDVERPVAELMVEAAPEVTNFNDDLGSEF